MSNKSISQLIYDFFTIISSPPSMVSDSERERARETTKHKPRMFKTDLWHWAHRQHTHTLYVRVRLQLTSDRRSKNLSYFKRKKESVSFFLLKIHIFNEKFWNWERSKSFLIFWVESQFANLLQHVYLFVHQLFCVAKIHKKQRFFIRKDNMLRIFHYFSIHPPFSRERESPNRTVKQKMRWNSVGRKVRWRKKNLTWILGS